jgi:co-chaperonin GroES (HSP10)
MDQKEIHEKMRNYLTPMNGHVIVEYVRNLKTSGGIYLPEKSEHTKSIAHPVVAAGAQTDLKVGDWVALRPMQVDVFKMYDREFAIIRDFDVMMKVDMAYLKDEAEFKTKINDN